MARPDGGLLTAMAILAILQTTSCDRTYVETPSKATTISYPPSNKLMCSIDPKIDTDVAPDFTPLDPVSLRRSSQRPCKPIGEVILSNDNNFISAPYQWRIPIQLWKKNFRYIASFTAFYALNLKRDIKFRSRPLFGGGLAFAITSDLSMVGTDQETFGLFLINEQTGASLRGANTETVAVEMDVSGIDKVSSSDLMA